MLSSFRTRLGDMSLRTKFLGALLLSVSIPLALVSIFFTGMYMDATTRSSQSLMRDKLHIASLVLNNTRTELLNITKAISGETMMPINLGLFLYPPIAQHLKELATQQHLAFAVVLDDQGTLVASARQADRLVPGLTPVSPQVLAAARESGGTSSFALFSANDFTIAEGFPLTAVDRMLCIVSLVPIKDHADFLTGYTYTAIILGPQGINGTHRIMTTLATELEVPYLFMDPSGIIETSFADLPDNLPDGQSIFHTLDQNPESHSFQFSAGPAQYHASFSGLPDWSGTAAAVIGIALTDADMVRTRTASLLFLVLVTLLVFGISIFLARLLSNVLARPILDVAAGTKKIISGDFDITIAVHGHDEIGQMAEDFTVMTLQLKKLIQELNHEIHEHSQAEAHIRRLNDELEDRVQHRTLELTQANAALTESLGLLKKTQSDLIESEKMAALNNLVAGVAHEINTPIGNCITAISFLGDNTRQFSLLVDENHVTRKDLETFLKDVRNVEELSLGCLNKAADLVHFFKQVAVDPNEEQPVLLNLQRYCEELLSGMHLRTRYPDIQFDNTLSPAIMVKTLPGALYRAVSNILSNAIDHAFKESRHRPGMVTPPRISLEAVFVDSNIALQVTDNGCGMEQNVVTRIFEPFFTTGRSRGHVGLGLSITYNLVHKSLGGSITCQSTPGMGSTFTIRLPAADVMQVNTGTP